MALLFIGMLVLIAAGSAAATFFARVRQLDASSLSRTQVPDADRYRPMLRLLSDSDIEITAAKPALRRSIRSRRREMFRGYLRCLTKDYAALLSGVRRVMAESGVDRPDLAKALAKNRALFALALCRIELDLQLHALGIGKVDVSGLVGAFDALRSAAAAMTPMAIQSSMA